MLFSFCSVSDFNKHGPSAIWAHLKPILQQVQQKIPSIETVHFVSDGPTTRYCCKQNFYLFSTQLLENFHFKSGLWNFLEAGHGKGPADGIGGAIKRAADAFVANGGSITNAKSLDFVQNVDVNDIEVKVMHRIGTNRYFWPLLEDVLWYSHGDVVAYIGQPSAVGSRHFQLSQAEWEFVVRSLNL